jgi:anti-sigma regulatory factor (Ser/Thr protein kinase)
MSAAFDSGHRRGFVVRFPRAAVFDHPGLIYHSPADYLKVTTGFVRAAVAAWRPVLVAVPEPNLSLLRTALADVTGRVEFADMTEAGRNPGNIIPNVLLAFAARHRRRPAIIGEPIWAGRTAVEYPACAQHEGLINAAFAGHGAEILCPYDAATLDEAWVRDAWRTHPVMITTAGRRPSPWYTDPYDAAAEFNRPLPHVPAQAATMSYTSAAALPGVHDWIAAFAADLPAGRARDLATAVDELTKNTIAHDRAGGTVSAWWENQHLACQVDNDAHLTDPLAGRTPPPAATQSGRGLLLVNTLCDLVRIHTTADHTSIRIHFRR